MYVLSVLQVEGEEFRRNFRRYRVKAQAGEAVEVRVYGEPAGYLVPLKDVAGVTEEISLQDFRGNLTDCYDRLASGEVDAFVLTFHRKPRAGFVRKI